MSTVEKMFPGTSGGILVKKVFSDQLFSAVVLFPLFLMIHEGLLQTVPKKVFELIFQKSKFSLKLKTLVKDRKSKCSSTVIVAQFYSSD